MVNIGIIGAGGIAQKLHLPELAKTPGARVTWLCGRRESRLRTLAERFDVPQWSQHPEGLLSDPDLHAIIVALPHPLHVEAGLQALAAGKHLMMQKPLCANMDEANQFVQAVEDSVQVVMCFPHFSRAIYKAREMVQEGVLGMISGAHCRTSHGGPEVYYAEVQDGFGEQDQDLWFFDPAQASVGALFDMGVYAVAQLVAALGSVVAVSGMTATLTKPTPLEDTATLLLQFQNGAIATAETSWCDPARTSVFRVHGAAGKLTCPGEAGAELTHWTPGSYTREDIPPTAQSVDLSDSGVGSAHGHWLDCIRQGINPPLSNARAARHVTEILLAGLESAHTRQRVEVRSRC